MVLGSKVKNIRELKNFTQEYVAEKLSMSQSNYSRIESNDVDIPFSKLQQIADVLEIKIQDLIEFDAKYFFNTVNSQTIHGDVVHNASENERKLYEQQIQVLKEEVLYLKKVIDSLMK